MKPMVPQEDARDKPGLAGAAARLKPAPEGTTMVPMRPIRPADEAIDGDLSNQGLRRTVLLP